MKQWFKILVSAGRSWTADNVFQYAAAVSFSTLFSLAPITIIAVTIAGVFFGQQAASEALEKQITSLVGPASAEMVRATIKATQATHTSTWSTLVGIGLVLFGATTVFGQLQSALNQIWHVRAKPSKSGWLQLVMQRLLSFAIVLTLGFLLLVSLIVSTTVATLVAHYGTHISGSAALLRGADVGAGLLIVTVLFALLFKVLPDVRLGWREVWLGAGITAVLFTIGRYVIALYLGHSTVATVYGTAGSLVALLMWVYYTCAILFYGVEVMRAYRKVHHLKSIPKDTAVLVHEEYDIIEQP